MDYIIARKVLKKFESMNVNFVRDEITGLIEYIEAVRRGGYAGRWGLSETDSNLY